MGIRAGLGRHVADISLKQAQYIGIVWAPIEPRVVSLTLTRVCRRFMSTK